MALHHPVWQEQPLLWPSPLLLLQLLPHLRSGVHGEEVSQVSPSSARWACMEGSTNGSAR